MAIPKIKITVAAISLMAASFTFQACNSKPKDKSGIESENGEGDYGNASGSDTSHTTSRVRKTISGVNPQPETKPANGATTAQGQMGGDSVYQKSTQKSQ